MPGALVRRSCAVSQVRCMSAAVPKVPMLINNEFVHSSTDKFIELRNPANNEVIGLVPESTQEAPGRFQSCQGLPSLARLVVPIYC